MPSVIVRTMVAYGVEQNDILEPRKNLAGLSLKIGPKRMHSAKILAETEMNQHSGKILATIAFQIPVHLQTQTHMQHHKHMQHHEHT